MTSTLAGHFMDSKRPCLCIDIADLLFLWCSYMRPNTIRESEKGVWYDHHKHTRDNFYDLKASDISYHYPKTNGLIGFGPYQFYLVGRIYEAGILRANLLRPRHHVIKHFHPQYLIGRAVRYESMVSDFTDLTQQLYVIPKLLFLCADTHLFV
jgi:hypothetical protein